MSVGFARPDVSQLVFRVFDRSVHPELLRTHATWSAGQSEFTVRAGICDAGHVVAVRLRTGTLTEVALPVDHPLPTERCRLEKPMGGSRSATLELAELGVRMQLHHQVETVEPEVFLNLHEELLHDCRGAELAHTFTSINRFAPAAISLLRVDAQRDHLLVHAYHTFPDTCAIVRTQSLLEL